ncbi:MAG: RNA-binding protein [Candidatus Cloacimonetes bacterium]|nr:RNA-binding protein [Candidatus Cloacimonadota bacterium]
MEIFIGNICKEITQDHLRVRLEEFGKVESVIVENEVAFAEMPFENEAELAILSLDKSDMDGFVISVHKARFGTPDRRKSGRIGGRRSKDSKSYTKMFSKNDLLI